MRISSNLSFTITTALILLAGAAPVHAAVPTHPTTQRVVSVRTIDEPIRASPAASLNLTHSAITSTAAPVVHQPVVVQAVAPAASAPVAPPAVQIQPAAVAPTPPPVQPPAQPPVSVGSSAIAAAALAQLGVHQDCTALVSNALAAVGIHFHGWPAGYLSLGPTVGAAQAQPGDLIFYANGGMGLPHIAVYIGGGQAVHGGWNGDTTVIASAYVGSGPVFIHV